MRRAAAVLAITGAVTAAAVAGSGAATRPAGLRGTVKEMRAICVQGDSCQGPAAGVTMVFTRAGRVAKRITTNGAGGYRVLLAPGIYTVTSSVALPPRGHVTPPSVRVYAGRVRHVDFVVASGIHPQ